MTVGVVGAGAAGLATASALRRRGVDVVVFEAADRAGGVLGSERRDGYLLERGATSIRGGDPAIPAALGPLGLLPRVVAASASARRRFVLRGGRLRAVPRELPAWGWGRLLRAAAEPFAPPVRGPASVADFLGGRLGALGRELADPLMAGIYAGDPALLDAESALARPWAWAREHGSLLGAALHAPSPTPPVGSFTFVDGVSELVDALVDDLGDALRLATPVRAMVPEPRGWRLETDRGRERVDRVIYATAPRADLLPAALLDALPPVPRAPVASIHLGYRDAPDPGGFGWLCPSSERRDVLGVLWVSSTFPGHAPPGAALYRVMVGGTRAPALVDRDDAALREHACALLREHQGVTAEPALVDVARALPGIPQYPIGYARALAHATLPGVTFTGWSWGRIGLADILVDARRISRP